MERSRCDLVYRILLEFDGAVVVEEGQRWMEQWRNPELRPPFPKLSGNIYVLLTRYTNNPTPFG